MSAQKKIETKHFSSSWFFFFFLFSFFTVAYRCTLGTIHDKAILQDTLHGASLVSLSAQRDHRYPYMSVSPDNIHSLDATCIPPLSFHSSSPLVSRPVRKERFCVRSDARLEINYSASKLILICTSTLQGSNVGLRFIVDHWEYGSGYRIGQKSLPIKINRSFLLLRTFFSTFERNNF